MIRVLRVAGARFVRSGAESAEPFDLELDAGQRADIARGNASQASIAARLCCGIIKPTTGAVYIMDYDSRLQPAQAKRWAGFVDAAGFVGEELDFARQVALRAEVWSIDSRQASARTDAVFAAFESDRDDYVRGVALALVPHVALLVLDQPRSGVLEKVAAMRPDLAVVTTRIKVGEPQAGAVLTGRR